jgi:hypothetical protein
MYADTEDRIRQAIAGSIEACFIIFGERDDTQRPCPLSLAKFSASACSHSRTQLGLVVNTETLCISMPPKKLAAIAQLITQKFHDGRRQISIVEGATLLGNLEHAGCHFPWFRQAYSTIRSSFNTALSKAKKRSSLVNTYIDAKRLEGASFDDYHSNLARFHRRQIEREIFRQGGQEHKIWITPDFRNDLNLISSLVSDASLWNTPIPHIIPRVHDFNAYCDSCQYGAGGFSTELGFMWHWFWPSKVSHSKNTIVLDMDFDHPTGTTHINLLEYAALLITYAIAKEILAENPTLADHSYPTVEIHTDNTSALCWTKKTIASSDSVAKHLARLACSLQINTRLGLVASHIEGASNCIADSISRCTPDDSPIVCQLQALQARHSELQNCKIYQVPPELGSLLTSLLLRKSDPPTIMWQNHKGRLRAVNGTSQRG